MTETELRFLRLLRNSKPKGLQRSRIAKSCKPLIEALLTCGAAEFRASQHGRGVVLSVLSDEAFSRFISTRLPKGIDIDSSDIVDRATAVAFLADAKAVRLSSAQGIFVRSSHPATVIASSDGEYSIPIGELTQQTGAAAIQLSSTKSWTFCGTVALVENSDAFWQHEVVLPSVDFAILGSGNLSERLLSWLSSPEMHDCKITYWGDYDPVGVYQYTRLSDACPGRVEPFAPPEIEELLPRHGKPNLITDQVSYLERLRDRVSDPYIMRMTQLFDLHRRGLEQEVLLYQERLPERA